MRRKILIGAAILVSIPVIYFSYWVVEALRVNALVKSGKEHYLAGRHQQAIKDFSSAIVISPEIALLYAARGTAYLYSGSYEPAIADLSKYLESRREQKKATEAEPLYLRAHAYFRLGRFEDAVRDYTAAIDLAPGVAETYLERGWCRISLGLWREAINDLDRAIELGQRSSQAYERRAFAYKELSDYDSALADYTSAIRLSKDNKEAYAGRGMIYAALGRRELARSDFDRLRELDPGYAARVDLDGAADGRYFGASGPERTGSLEELLARGKSAAQKKDYKTALHYYSKAIDLEPEDPRAYVHRANVHGKYRRFREAVADCSEAAGLDPGNEEAALVCGAAEAGAGNCPAAVQWFAKAIAINPASAEAYANRARCNIDKGAKAAALRDCAKVLAMRDSPAVPLNTCGGVFYYAGDSARAMTAYGRAISRDHKYADPYYNRGEVREAMGDTAAAVQDYRKALELDPGHTGALEALRGARTVGK